MAPVIRDDARGLSEDEIAEACRDFVARGAMAQASADAQVQRCECGHIRAQHGPTVDACACFACECREFCTAADHAP